MLCLSKLAFISLQITALLIKFHVLIVFVYRKLIVIAWDLLAVAYPEVLYIPYSVVFIDGKYIWDRVVLSFLNVQCTPWHATRLRSLSGISFVHKQESSIFTHDMSSIESEGVVYLLLEKHVVIPILVQSSDFTIYKLLDTAEFLYIRLK